MSTLLLKSIFLCITLCLTLFLMPQQTNAARAFYVFGDSLVDSGNNNYLFTTARADFPPYGIDYPNSQPTGRFSNGLNIPDIISEHIGSEPTLPILCPELTGDKLLIGANFASAGVGILNDTGFQFLSILKIGTQLEYFQKYQDRVSEMIGFDKTQELVNEALVLITLGGNDFVNNYFFPFSIRSRLLSLGDFIQLLISEYKKILKRLYDLGARRVMVTGTGPLGCIPAELAASRSPNGECAPEVQQAAAIFNPLLVEMLLQLNVEFGSNVFIGANAFNINLDFISNPEQYGFVTSKVACCGQGPYNGLGICNPLSSLCNDRTTYAFWDPFHPTEKAARLIVQQIMFGSVDYMNPMNLSTIMALDSRM